eukprot:g3846.t1
MFQTVNNAYDVLDPQQMAGYDRKNGVVDSLEMLRPNRTQSFAALLKDVKVFKFNTSSSSASNNKKRKDYVTLIFSDEDHVEVALRCSQPYFQRQETIKQLTNFKNCVCRVENIFVSQAPFVNKKVAGRFYDKMHLHTTMKTSIYCLEYSNRSVQNVLIRCGRLRPIFRISGYICDLIIPNTVLQRLINDGEIADNCNKDYDNNNNIIDEDCILYVKQQAFHKKLNDSSNGKNPDSNKEIATLSATPPTTAWIQIHVSLQILSRVLLNGISLNSLFKYSLQQEQNTESSATNNLNANDQDANFFLGWHMLSSMMKTQLAGFPFNDEMAEKPLMCFVVTKEDEASVCTTSSTKIDSNGGNNDNDNDMITIKLNDFSKLQLVDAKIL